jgi:hypothetical protein
MMKLLITQFIQPPVTSSLSGPNNFLDFTILGMLGNLHK